MKKFKFKKLCLEWNIQHTGPILNGDIDDWKTSDPPWPPGVFVWINIDGLNWGEFWFKLFVWRPYVNWLNWERVALLMTWIINNS